MRLPKYHRFTGCYRAAQPGNWRASVSVLEAFGMNCISVRFAFRKTRLSHVAHARQMQIMNLALLALDIQGAIRAIDSVGPHREPGRPGAGWADESHIGGADYKLGAACIRYEGGVVVTN